MISPSELPSYIREIQGAEHVLAWFGHWPSFHDANITNLNLSTSDKATLTLDTSEMTSELDEQGYYRHVKHCSVTFIFEGISDFNFFGDLLSMGIIFGLGIEQLDGELEFRFDPCAGLAGNIRAKQTTILLTPQSK